MSTHANRAPRILLIEDNPADARLVKECLCDRMPSAELMVAKDGEEGLRMLKDGADSRRPLPDIVLLDLNMPRMSGHEVLREIKHDPELRSLPVIVLTSSGYEADIRMAYEMQASSYVVKPRNLEELEAAIGSIMNFWFGSARLPERK
ncbi:MAG: response regulator [Methanomassiliicoccales archaeon]|nr:response regulator [Methanomassiliicoccales archaeon]